MIKQIKNQSKYRHMRITYLLFALVLVACGKKTHENSASLKKTEVQLSVEEKEFNHLKEIRKTILNNNLLGLKIILQENPLFNLNSLLHDGETPLSLSIKLDHREIRNFLIERDVDLNRKNANQQSPLMTSIIHSKENSFKVLLDRQIDLEIKDANSETALFYAVKLKHESMALELIKRGARTDLIDFTEKSLYDLALFNQLPEVIEALKTIKQVENGTPTIDVFRKVVAEANYNSLKTILIRFPDLANQYEDLNPLEILTYNQDENSALRTAELLLKYKVNVDGPEKQMSPPIISAIKNNKIGFFHLFINNKANLSLLDNAGKSSLIYAIEMNSVELVSILIGHKVPVKYTIKTDGSKKSFNACSVAKKVGKQLKSDADIGKNQQIKDLLECGFFSSFF